MPTHHGHHHSPSHTYRGLACFLAVISTFALIISAAHTYFTATSERQCQETLQYKQLNYTMIALSGALMIILWVFFGITWVQVKDKKGIQVMNAFLVIAWVFAVAGTVISCIQEPNVRAFNNSCHAKSAVNPSFLMNGKWISYSMISVFGVCTIVLMAWIYIHCRDLNKHYVRDGGHHTPTSTTKTKKHKKSESHEDRGESAAGAAADRSTTSGESAASAAADRGESAAGAAADRGDRSDRSSSSDTDSDSASASAKGTRGGGRHPHAWRQSLSGAPLYY